MCDKSLILESIERQFVESVNMEIDKEICQFTDFINSFCGNVKLDISWFSWTVRELFRRNRGYEDSPYKYTHELFLKKYTNFFIALENQKKNRLDKKVQEFIRSVNTQQPLKGTICNAQF